MDKEKEPEKKPCCDDTAVTPLEPGEVCPCQRDTDSETDREIYAEKLRLKRKAQQEEPCDEDTEYRCDGCRWVAPLECTRDVHWGRLCEDCFADQYG